MIKKILLLFFVLLVVFGCIAVSFLIVQPTNPNLPFFPLPSPTPLFNGEDENTIDPLSYPVTDPSSTIPNQYEFIVIDKDGGISIYNKIEERIIVSLSNLNWSSPKWNNDKSFFAVLSENPTNVFNLYVYDVSKRTLTKVSNYNEIGISGYTWTDNENILFTQGESPENWLHIYNLKSNNILKVSRVNGSLYKSNFTKLFLIFQTNKHSFEISNARGEKIIEISDFDFNDDSFKVIDLDYITNNLFIVTAKNQEEKLDFFIRSNTGSNYEHISLENISELEKICIGRPELVYSVSKNGELRLLELVNTLNLGWNFINQKVLLAGFGNEYKLNCINRFVSIETEREKFYFLENNKLEYNFFSNTKNLIF